MYRKNQPARPSVSENQFLNLLDILEEELGTFSKEEFNEYLEEEVGMEPLEVQFPEMVEEELRVVYASTILSLLSEMTEGSLSDKRILEQAGFTKNAAALLTI